MVNGCWWLLMVGGHYCMLTVVLPTLRPGRRRSRQEWESGCSCGCRWCLGNGQSTMVHTNSKCMRSAPFRVGYGTTMHHLRVFQQAPLLPFIVTPIFMNPVRNRLCAAFFYIHSCCWRSCYSTESCTISTPLRENTELLELNNDSKGQ